MFRSRFWPPPALVAPLLALALLPGCTSSPTPDASSARTVRSYLAQDPVSLSLLGKGGDVTGEIVAYLITDSLLQYDSKLNLLPRLARSWQLSEDRRTLTFDLRRGVTWHDGQPFTARDVVYSVQLVREPGVENRSFGPLFSELQSIEALDDHTVRAIYANPTPGMLDAWRLPLIPEHLAGREARPGDGSAATLLQGDFAEHPVGCGPFRLLSYRPNQEILLQANDDYWAGRPAIDRLALKIFPDQRTAFHALLGGELDTMHVSSVLYHEAQQSDAAQRLEGRVYYTSSVWQITWNADGSNPFFDDPRVRQAMILALDRQGFSQAMQDGLARPGATVVHPDTAWANPDVQPLPYDPARARRLLDEAGWIDRDGDGVRDRDGVAFRFDHLYPQAPSQVVDQLAAWQQQSWAEVGIEARNDRLEWRAFQRRRNARQFHAASFRLSFLPSAEDLSQLLHSSSRGDGWNFSGLNDPQVDRLLEQARAEFDEERRRQLIFRLQVRLQELEPISSLFYFPTPLLFDRRLRGVTPSAIDYWRHTEGAATWHWEN